MSSEQMALNLDEAPEEIVYAHDLAALRGTGLPTYQQPVLVLSNGGGRIEPLESLFERLRTETLEPSFRRFGNFMERDEQRPDVMRFWGGFLTYSHVFDVRCLATSRMALRLQESITRATMTEAYLAACKEEDQWQVERKEREARAMRGING